jgi:hypothetical protein
MAGLELLTATQDASGGFDWTAPFAGLAAITGILAIVVTTVGQSRQHDWEAKQEQDRRAWESGQESQRRQWEQSQLVSTRWDDLKRERYVEFLGSFDDVVSIQESKTWLHRDLDEDFETRLMHIEDYMKRAEPSKLRELEAGSMEEQRAYWDGLREEQRSSAVDELRVLRERENEAQRTLSRALGEIRVVAPANIVRLAEELAGAASYVPRYGRRHEQEVELGGERSRYVDAVRTDLQIPEVDGSQDR